MDVPLITSKEYIHYIPAFSSYFHFEFVDCLIHYQFLISGTLYFVNSTVNPILYNLMSKKFQLAFKRTLCRCRKLKEYEINSSFAGSSSPYRDKSLPYNYSRIGRSADKIPTIVEPETATTKAEQSV